MLNRLVSRRAVVTSAAAATVPAVALAAHQAGPDPALDGLAVMQIGGRRLLVDTTRPPTPGDEVLALVPQKTGRTSRLDVFRAVDGGDRFTARPYGDRTVLWAEPPRYVAAMGETIQTYRYSTCVGVVVGDA
jgi:hypothetical protein